MRCLFIVLSIFAFFTNYGFSSQNLTDIKLQLLWHHQFEFAGFYVAKQKGFYKEAGLNVEIIEAKPDTNVTDEVVSKRADFGIHNTTLILDRYAGSDVSIVSTMFQHSPLALAFSNISDIKSIADLKNKTIMIGGDGAEIIAMLKKEGLEENSYKIIPHNYNPKALTQKQADAMSVFTTNELFFLEKEKIPYKVFKPESYGIDFYGNFIFTRGERLRGDQQTVDAFVEASNKGWLYALSHINEAILITSKYSQKSIEALRYEADKTIPLIAADKIRIGFINEKRWEHVSKIYAELGMLPDNFMPDNFLYIKGASTDKNFTYILWGIAIVFFVFSVVYAYFLYRKAAKQRESEKLKLTT